MPFDDEPDEKVQPPHAGQDPEDGDPEETSDAGADKELSEGEESVWQRYADENLWQRYAKELGSYKMLPRERVWELARRVRESNDIEARNTLVKHNLRLVIRTASSYAGPDARPLVSRRDETVS